MCLRNAETRMALPNLVFNRCQLWREWSACHEYWWNVVCVCVCVYCTIKYTHLYGFVILPIKKTAFPQKLSLSQEAQFSLVNCGLQLFHMEQGVKIGQGGQRKRMWYSFITLPPGSVNEPQSTPKPGLYDPQFFLDLEAGVRRKATTGSWSNSITSIFAPFPLITALDEFSNRIREQTWLHIWSASLILTPELCGLCLAMLACTFYKRMLLRVWNIQDSPFSRLWPFHSDGFFTCQVRRRCEAKNKPLPALPVHEKLQLRMEFSVIGLWPSFIVHLPNFFLGWSDTIFITEKNNLY